MNDTCECGHERKFHDEIDMDDALVRQLTVENVRGAMFTTGVMLSWLRRLGKRWRRNEQARIRCAY